MTVQHETARGVTPEVDGRDHVGGARPVRERTPETKTFLGTSEFWVTVAAIAALVVIWIANHHSTLTLFRACLLGTIVVSTYVLSRGFAKAGSQRDVRVGRDDGYRGA